MGLRRIIPIGLMIAGVTIMIDTLIMAAGGSFVIMGIVGAVGVIIMGIVIIPAWIEHRNWVPGTWNMDATEFGLEQYYSINDRRKIKKREKLHPRCESEDCHYFFGPYSCWAPGNEPRELWKKNVNTICSFISRADFKKRKIG